MEKIVEKIYHGHTNFVVTREVVQVPEPEIPLRILASAQRRKQIAKIRAKIKYWHDILVESQLFCLKTEDKFEFKRKMNYIDGIVKPTLDKYEAELKALTSTTKK